MPVFPIKAFADNYIWAIKDENTDFFDCIDPGDALPVLAYAEQQQLQLRNILLTHHHHDHIGGVEKLINTYPSCRVYGPQDIRIPNITHPVHKNESIQLGNFIFNILSNPGHTSTHISYYETKHGWLFCGDTLFSGGCGRVFDGTIEDLHQSLMFFKSLPPDTKIFCAHEYTINNLKFAQTVEPNNHNISQYAQKLAKYPSSCSLPSSLALELTINPFLRTETSDVQRYALNHGALNLNSLEVFKILREEKNLLK